MLHDISYYQNLDYNQWIQTEGYVAFFARDVGEWWIINGAWSADHEHMDTKSQGVHVTHFSQFHSEDFSDMSLSRDSYRDIMTKVAIIAEQHYAEGDTMGTHAGESPKQTVGVSLQDLM